MKIIIYFVFCVGILTCIIGFISFARLFVYANRYLKKIREENLLDQITEECYFASCESQKYEELYGKDIR